MSQSEQKVVQYLNEAHASEMALVSALESQIAITPRGSYRQGLEKHLDETHTHARRIEERLGELGEGRNPFQLFVGFTETVIGHMLALSKTPLDLLRGSGGEEKVLKNAKDACATEALEIATYTALERLASKVGDDRTVKLAASICGEEERMLKRILREIPKLTDAVVAADVEGHPSYDVARTGAAHATREVARRTSQTARRIQARAPRASRSARQTAEGQVERRGRGARGSREALPIQNYRSLSAEEIVGRLQELSQRDLSRIDAFERKNHKRTAVLTRITELRQPEPWPGYDELTVAEVEAVLGEGDDQRAQRVAAYERVHKNRPAVLQSALIPARFLTAANK
jgi:ferritin-like metal-binding protein YciE